MTKVSVVGPDDGEVIQLGPTRMRILEDGTPPVTGSGWARSRRARAPGPPQHRHARHDEGFYVVSGTASFTIGARPTRPPRGRW